MQDYQEFLKSKSIVAPPDGFPVEPSAKVNAHLSPFQSAITAWALRRGRAAIFADTGLGKTRMQLAWADHIVRETGRSALILAPLCVAQQTVQEGERIGIEAQYVRAQSPLNAMKAGIYITNYEMLDKFNLADYGAIVLDESSILKSIAGKTRKALIAAAQDVQYRLSCTATPSPNDFMEFGGQSEFLGVMNQSEMLATFFTHDGGDTSKWRLKGHGRKSFWEWVATWAVYIQRPSDIGFPDDGYALPPPVFQEHIVSGETMDGYLFPVEANTMKERLAARRGSVGSRAAQCAEIANADTEQWIVWCHLNAESDALAKSINGAVAVSGADKIDEKERKLMAFQRGEIRVLVTKPSIAGFGLNWQHCRNMAFVGLSDSFEEFYQAVRRCWRFGQTKTVNVHIVAAETEGAVLSNIHRKERQASEVAREMIQLGRDAMTKQIQGAENAKQEEYRRDVAQGDGWTLHLADCVDLAREVESNSIDYSIFSPPFSSLYTYSNSDRDMGNSVGDDMFMEHFGFLVAELFRMVKPGRLLSFHCMNLPSSKQHHGVIGIRDFRGDLIRLFQSAGWIYHSEVCIWKDPVTAMQRTKALGLLHKTIRTDSSRSRQGLPDYLVTMRKPGDNAEPIAHTPEEFPVSLWQRYASPVWMDIDQGKTLNGRGARENDDERHIAPLQLEVIERALMLWTAPNDLVFSPFTGIGSEGYVSLQMGRRFIGSELKVSYWEQARRNLASAIQQTSLLASAPEESTDAGDDMGGIGDDCEPMGGTGSMDTPPSDRDPADPEPF